MRIKKLRKLEKKEKRNKIGVSKLSKETDLLNIVKGLRIARFHSELMLKPY